MPQNNKSEIQESDVDPQESYNNRRTAEKKQAADAEAEILAERKAEREKIAAEKKRIAAEKRAAKNEVKKRIAAEKRAATKPARAVRTKRSAAVQTPVIKIIYMSAEEEKEEIKSRTSRKSLKNILICPNIITLNEPIYTEEIQEIFIDVPAYRLFTRRPKSETTVAAAKSLPVIVELLPTVEFELSIVESEPICITTTIESAPKPIKSQVVNTVVDELPVFERMFTRWNWSSKQKRRGASIDSIWESEMHFGDEQWEQEMLDTFENLRLISKIPITKPEPTAAAAQPIIDPPTVAATPVHSNIKCKYTPAEDVPNVSAPNPEPEIQEKAAQESDPNPKTHYEVEEDIRAAKRRAGAKKAAATRAANKADAKLKEEHPAEWEAKQKAARAAAEKAAADKAAAKKHAAAEKWAAKKAAERKAAEDKVAAEKKAEEKFKEEHPAEWAAQQKAAAEKEAAREKMYRDAAEYMRTWDNLEEDERKYQAEQDAIHRLKYIPTRYNNMRLDLIHELRTATTAFEIAEISNKLNMKDAAADEEWAIFCLKNAEMIFPKYCKLYEEVIVPIINATNTQTATVVECDPRAISRAAEITIDESVETVAAADSAEPEPEAAPEYIQSVEIVDITDVEIEMESAAKILPALSIVAPQLVKQLDLVIELPPLFIELAAATATQIIELPAVAATQIDEVPAADTEIITNDIAAESECAANPEPEIAAKIPAPAANPHITMPPQKFSKIADLSDHVAAAKMESHLAVRNEYPYNHFLLFASAADFEAHMAATPKDQRCFHEVITDSTPRAFYVDIDDVAAPRSEWCKIINAANVIFRAALTQHCDCEYKDIANECVVIDSSGFSKLKNCDKFSIQIRTVHIVTSAKDAEKFAELFAKWFVEELVEQKLHQVKVDMGVYKSKQNMRIPGSTKLNDDRWSRIIWPQNIPLSHCWIGIHGEKTKLIYDLTPFADQNSIPIAAQQFDVADDTIRYILENTKEHYAGFTVRRVTGSLITFNRGAGSVYCELCGRAHDSDNSLFFRVAANGTVYKGCWRNEGKNTIPIFSVDRIVPQDDTAAEDLDEDEKKPAAATSEPAEFVPLKSEDLYKKYINDKPRREYLNLAGYKWEKYTADTMRDYKPAATTVVHANKGLGKTEALTKYINSLPEDAIIVVLSHRISFSTELLKHIPGAVCYNELDKGAIDLLQKPRVIVQLESLQRLNIGALGEAGRGVDLLIMDESESVIPQLSSGLHKEFSGAWTNFNWLTKYSDTVIALDAHISQRTIDVLNVRGGDKLYIRNDKVASDRTILVTPSDKVWYRAVFDSIEAGEKIVIPTNSATIAKAIGLAINQRYPSKKVQVYTASTDKELKKQHITNIATVWKEFDVLIYSPTISAGVSFKEIHFDKMFGFFRVGSAPAGECDQMLGRVRDIGSKTTVVYIDPRNTHGYCTRAELRHQVLTSRRNIFEEYSAGWMTYETMRDGTRRPYCEEYFNIWLHNTHVMIRSKNNLARELINIFKSTGAKVEFLESAAADDDESELEKEQGEIAKKIITAAVQDVKFEERKMIADAEDIDIGSAAVLKESKDRTPQQDVELHRFYSQAPYGWAGLVTVNWLAAYDNERSKNWHKSLNAIAEKDGLENIRKMEQIRQQKLFEEEERSGNSQTANAHEWNKNYYYDKHRVATGFLNMLGFENVLDELIMPADYIMDAIEENLDQLRADYTHNRVMFGTKEKANSKPLKDFAAALKYINSILYKMYGIHIGGIKETADKKNKIPTEYRIFHLHNLNTEDSFMPQNLLDVGPLTEQEDTLLKNWIRERIEMQKMEEDEPTDLSMM
jgi:Origin of replication binding protein